MSSDLPLMHYPLFRDIDTDALRQIRSKLRRIEFAPGDHLCRQGEPGDSLFLVESGLLEVWLETGGRKSLLKRMRHGEVVGEMALLTGEPRSAHVVAAVSSTALELDAKTFAAIVADHPQVLRNIALILIKREKENAEVRTQRDRGEAVTLVVGPQFLSAAPKVIEAAEAASRTLPTVVDLTASLRPRANRVAKPSVAALLAELDTLVQKSDRVLVLVEAYLTDLPALLRHMDRVVLVTDKTGADRFDTDALSGLCAEIFLVGSNEGDLRNTEDRRVVRAAPAGPLPADVRWLGRHLARAKLGLALGAGGAKGFAHVGAFQVLEDAGYVFDYVAGSSIGSILGSCIAMGMSGPDLSSTAQWLLSKEVCGTYFRLLSPEEGELGHVRFYDALSELSGDQMFAALPCALAVMTADLNARAPFIFQSGRLEHALHAALSIPGLAPPYEYGNRRLVDGVTIAPVPTAALTHMGADITVSVNLMNRNEIDQWPEGDPESTIAKKRSKTLDPIVETLVMLQLDTSVRNAAEADVVISPRFAPSSWRDIHLADRFEAAGRRAAEEELPALQAMVMPQSDLA